MSNMILAFYCLLLASASFARSDCTFSGGAADERRGQMGDLHPIKTWLWGRRYARRQGAQMGTGHFNSDQISWGIYRYPTRSYWIYLWSTKVHQLIKSLETPFSRLIHLERLSYCRFSFFFDNLACRPDSAKSGTGVPDSVSAPRSCCFIGRLLFGFGNLHCSSWDGMKMSEDLWNTAQSNYTGRRSCREMPHLDGFIWCLSSPGYWKYMAAAQAELHDAPCALIFEYLWVFDMGSSTNGVLATPEMTIV